MVFHYVEVVASPHPRLVSHKKTWLKVLESGSEASVVSFDSYR